MSDGLKNGLLVAASVVCGVLLLEFALRFFVTLPDPYPMGIRAAVADARGFWILNPGATVRMDNGTDFAGKIATIDGDGMRQVPCRAAAPSNPARRLFVIGDSQTFGFGLSDEESWPNRLQCILDRRGLPWAIYNLGVAGINADQYYRRLAQILPALRQGDAIVVVLTWNDLITDVSRFHATGADTAVCPARLRRPGNTAFPPCLVRPIRFLNPKATWRMKLYRATGVFVPSFGSLKDFLYSSTMASALAYIVVPKLKLLWYSVRGRSALFDKLPADSFRHNIRIAARMRDLAAAKGAETQIVLLPNRVFTDDFYYRAYSKGGTVFAERDYPRHATAAACHEYRVDCFSVFDALRTPERDRFTYVFDGHLNPAGARAVARALAEKLQRRFAGPSAERR